MVRTVINLNEKNDAVIIFLALLFDGKYEEAEQFLVENEKYDLVDARIEGKSVIYWACRARSETALKFLIEKEVDIKKNEVNELIEAIVEDFTPAGNFENMIWQHADEIEMAENVVINMQKLINEKMRIVREPVSLKRKYVLVADEEDCQPNSKYLKIATVNQNGELNFNYGTMLMVFKESNDDLEDETENESEEYDISSDFTTDEEQVLSHSSKELGAGKEERNVSDEENRPDWVTNFPVEKEEEGQINFEFPI